MDYAGEVIEGQSRGTGEGKVERSKAEEEFSEPSDSNPFLVEPILRKLLKKVDTVAQLKDFRKVCVLWDKVNTEELEERAFKGKLKAIDFEWTNRKISKMMAKKELIQFMIDTRSISRFFPSFKFNIPESLKILQNHSAFFSNYHIYGVELIAPYHTRFKDFEVAIKYFLSLIGPNLRDIKILHPNVDDAWGHHTSFEPNSPNWPKPKQELVLPKLEKLIIENKRWDKDLTEFFKSILARKGSGSSHIKSLVLTSLPGADIGSFPGLDPTRMTRLDIGGGKNEGFKGIDIALKYTTGLMTLVEKGMRLLDFGLKLDSDHDPSASLAKNLPRICSNLTHFLATQSTTLTTLDFHLEFSSTLPGSKDEIGAEVETYGKIQLPVFQALHTLSFDHRLQIYIANQDMKILAFSLIQATQSLPLHFPSLVNLTFDSECSMDLLFNNPALMEKAGDSDSRFHFKRLVITQHQIWIILSRWNKKTRGNWNMLYGSLIGSVDYLRVPTEVLEEVSIPWADSLREMRTDYVTGPLKLAHLKKLETLLIDDCRRVGYKPYVQEPTGASWEDDSDWESENRQEVFTEYLSWFEEAKQLNLTCIKFFGLQMENGIKEEFVRYFPFPVQFEEKGEDKYSYLYY